MSIGSFISRLKGKLMGGDTPTVYDPSDEELMSNARMLLQECRTALKTQIQEGSFAEAMLSARSIIRLGWWSIANVRFDTELDKDIENIGASLARDAGETDNSKVMYVTSGILAFGGLSQQLVNHLEYHDHERFEIHVYSTEQFSKSDLTSERAERVKGKCSFSNVSDPTDLYACTKEIADHIEEQGIGTIILLCSPDDVIGLVVARMFPHIPSVFINASHHVFTGGSFQFDAFVDVTGHYHKETLTSSRSGNPVYISLCGRATMQEVSQVKARDFRAELGLSSDALLTITVGNVSKNSWDGDDSYMHVIGSTLSEQPQVHHLLLASGAEKLVNEIKDAYPDVKERVHAIAPTPDIISALKGCDVYLNSFPMGGALSTLDAILAGLPVVFIAAHSEWFKKPEFTVQDGEGYKTLLTRYLTDTAFRSKAKEELEQLYREILSPKIVVQQYEELIESLTVNKNKAPLTESSLQLVRPRVQSYSKRLARITSGK